ncbi:hypothetical protein [Methanothermobacter sp. K4]|uniref:hypothetical protein n=1 Tax=Methanothermobacter sp. K4 TaxID=2913262 RepID=UPI001EDC843A|nr:hypothetical protein [Methanothermobacter sp. K4]MCG2827838.1 hypothetical protein [Methanothermobacter sp. K4]
MGRKYFSIFLVVWTAVFIVAGSVPHLRFKLIAGLLIFLFISGFAQRSPKKEALYLAAVLYPPAELALKSSVTLIDPVAVNMAEHFIAGSLAVLAASTVFDDTLERLDGWDELAFMVSAAVLFCLLYEITGYAVYYEPSAILYSDTMRDLSMNIAGAVMAASIITWYGIRSGD